MPTSFHEKNLTNNDCILLPSIFICVSKVFLQPHEHQPCLQYKAYVYMWLYYVFFFLDG